MPSPLPVKNLATRANEIRLEEGQKAYHLPDWNQLSHPDRLKVIRQLAMMRGRDPRIAKVAVRCFRLYKAQPREYVKQAAAILKWVQDPANVYYVNEPGERLQDPVYTIKAGHGDCDDMVILLCSLFETVGLPWKLVLSGRDAKGSKIRYIEGDPVPPHAQWAHIYAMVGDRPFRPSRWFFAEPTVQKVPLGWDVISGDASFLPEMAKPKKQVGPPKIMKVGKAPSGFVPAKLPSKPNRSPAYEMAYGDLGSSLVSGAVGASMAESVESQSSGSHGSGWLDVRSLLPAVVTGVAVSVGTSLALDWINGTGMWQSKGNVIDRWNAWTERAFRPGWAGSTPATANN